AVCRGCPTADCAGRARSFAGPRRRRSGAAAGQSDRRHRFGRQDRNQGSAAACAVQRRRDACLGRVLQQSLGRTAVAGTVSIEHAEADARLIKCALHAYCSTVETEVFGTQFSYKIGAPGRHLVINSLAVLAAAELVGADLALAALALAELRAASGRGAPIEIELPGGPALVLDESYNANPASVEAALAVLGRSP